MKKIIIILFGCVFLFCSITHADVTEGLIAHYPFEGNADDISGYDNHGDEFGGITYVAGEVGQSAHFDGVNDYFTFPQTFPFHDPTDVSMTFWLNAENRRQTLFWTGPLTDVNRFHILTGGNESDFEVDYRCPDCSESGNYLTVVANRLSFNTWTHIAVVRSGATYYTYVDGIFVQERTDTAPDLPTYVGSWFLGRSGIVWPYYEGMVDELRIYNRTLSENDVRMLVDPMDTDNDGIHDSFDNCPDIPNGPDLGTCTSGTVGETCNSNGECDPNGFCSMNQEDMDLDGSGDACDSNIMCRGLADYDQDVDALDVTMFLSHFGRSPFNNPCPIDGPAPCAKTGQTTSLRVADDGDLQVGVGCPDPRFTDLGDGTATDNCTGLMWTIDIQQIPGEMVWTDAIDACINLNFALHEDWRLPTTREFLSVIDYGSCSPALPPDHPFLNVQSDWFWNSTSRPCGDFGHSMVVNLTNGDSGGSGRGYAHRVWCVRGGH